jgi:hypothetical protein
MQKFILTLCVSISLQSISLISMQEQPIANKKDATLISRVIARYKHKLPEMRARDLDDLIMNLITQKKYGPELADLLDLKHVLDNYTYQAKGIYEHQRGHTIHSYTRHMCEAGVTQKDAETLHTEMEPPMVQFSDGTRHYAIMH